MNLGQAFGEMQLRISNLEDGGAVDQPSHGRTEALEIRRLRAELDASRTSETKALLEVARYKGELAARETIISDMRLRLAQKIADKTGSAKDYEAKLRGKDMQIDELQRKLDTQGGAIAEMAKRVNELESMPPQVVEKPAQVECPVCAPFIAAIKKAAGNGQEAKSKDDMNAGIRKSIRALLAKADEPIDATYMRNTLHFTTHQVSHALHAMADAYEIVRFNKAPDDRSGTAGRPGYRYWLAARPLPDGFQA